MASVTPAPLLLNNGYGGFDPDTFDYVVTDVRTPRPWINVLANERYGLVLSQAGGGFSWAGDCQNFRLNRWEQDLVLDRQGRFVYVLDLDNGAPWSTTFQPTRRTAESEEVRHAPGSATFSRLVEGIATRHTVAVPLDHACEVWHIEIENRSSQVRHLRLATYLEWFLGGVGDWHREFHRLFQETEAHGDTLIAFKHPGLKEGARERPEASPTAYLRWIGAPKVDWITDKAGFVGKGGDLSEPVGLASPEAAPRTGRWDDPVGVGWFDLTLQPGETASYAVVLGAEVDHGSALQEACGWTLDRVRQEIDRAERYWRQRSGKLDVRTGDAAVDAMMNAWLPYQAECGRMIARCAYYQQGGAYGYRDQLQDSLSLLPVDPARTLWQLRAHAEAMYEDGGVRHWWFPNAPIFSVSHHSDTSCWLAYGLLAYLDETADLGCLASNVRYLSRSTQLPSGERPLLDSAFTGVRRALDRRSTRGLPLIGAGDWNDGLSHVGLEGKGESVWMAMFLYDILRRWVPYFNRLGRPSDAHWAAAQAEELRVAVETHAWDGEWYQAGTRDDGRPFGSRECREGKIFLNMQTWAVISGIAAADRQARALQSVREHLLTPYGCLLLAPAYASVDPGIGYITRYAPGLRENGGVYSHASTWAVQAFAMAGDPDTALHVFRGMLPALRSEQDPDLYAAEPYSMPGNVDGPDSRFEGRAGWTWYTGSAAWMRRVCLEWLCGVRATYDGLEVEGSLPSAWQGVRLVRPFRGEEVQIVR